MITAAPVCGLASSPSSCRLPSGVFQGGGRCGCWLFPIHFLPVEQKGNFSASAFVSQAERALSPLMGPALPARSPASRLFPGVVAVPGVGGRIPPRGACTCVCTFVHQCACGRAAPGIAFLRVEKRCHQEVGSRVGVLFLAARGRSLHRAAACTLRQSADARSLVPSVAVTSRPARPRRVPADRAHHPPRAPAWPVCPLAPRLSPGLHPPLLPAQPASLLPPSASAC